MAIFGQIEDLAKQVPNNQRLKEGFNFLLNSDLKEVFTKMGDAKKEVIYIDGENLFAIFEQYQSKDLLKPIFEGHVKYTDIQYIVEGEELMHITTLDKITHEDDYQEDRDIYFPKVSLYSTLHATVGKAAIFFPEDLHAPSNCVKVSKLVKKVVVKVLNTPQ